ncbi:Phospholipase ABHD3 [Nymphon striatum]|nr:Phospholipase ABHD3 [Nymphon striatum]
MASSISFILLPALLFVLHRLNIFILPQLWFKTIPVVVFLILMSYYYIYVVKVPQLWCHPGKFRHLLIAKCPVITEHYWPTPWFLGSHISSIASHVIRGYILPVPKYTINIIQLSDGGEVALHWSQEKNINENKPIALFIAGVHGDSRTAYLRHMIGQASRLGFRCVVFHNRGLGGAAIKTPRLFCGANIEDLKEALDYIKNKYPESPIFATGCSLGGLHVTRYLIEMGEKSLIDYAMTVSVPWDSFIANSSMESSSVNLLLNRFLVTKSLKLVQKSRHLFEELEYLDMDHVFQSRTHKELDERFTTKIFGFKDINHHYTEQSIPGKLHNIKVPLLSLSSTDDHFSPRSALPCEECSKLDNVALVTTSWGGHIGFMDGFIPTAPFLMERLFCQYASAILPKLIKNEKTA